MGDRDEICIPESEQYDHENALYLQEGELPGDGDDDAEVALLVALVSAGVES